MSLDPHHIQSTYDRRTWAGFHGDGKVHRLTTIHYQYMKGCGGYVLNRWDSWHYSGTCVVSLT